MSEGIISDTNNRALKILPNVILKLGAKIIYYCPRDSLNNRKQLSYFSFKKVLISTGREDHPENTST